MSPTYLVFGLLAVKSRPIRSGTLAAAGSPIVVRGLRRSRRPAGLMLRITRAIRLWLILSPSSRSSAVILGTA
jgi:hypothetical protein